MAKKGAKKTYRPKKKAAKRPSISKTDLSAFAAALRLKDE